MFPPVLIFCLYFPRLFCEARRSNIEKTGKGTENLLAELFFKIPGCFSRDSNYNLIKPLENMSTGVLFFSSAASWNSRAEAAPKDRAGSCKILNLGPWP